MDSANISDSAPGIKKIIWTAKSQDPNNGGADSPHTVTREINEQLFVRPNILTRVLCLWTYDSWQRNVHSSINRAVQLSNATIKRPLSQDEVDALAELLSRRTLHARLGVPVGIFAGVYHTYRDAVRSGVLWASWEGHRLALNPELRGWSNFWAALKEKRPVREVAKSLAVRAIFYPLLAKGFSGIFAAMMFSRARNQEPRLREWASGVEKVAEEWKNDRIKAVQEKYQKKLEERQGQGQGRGQEQVFTDGPEHDQSFGTTSMGSSSAEEPKSHSLPDRSYQQQQQQPYRYPSQPEPTTSNRADFFDDASPVASDYPSEPPAQTQGSAWDRIRHQNVSGGGSPQRRDQVPSQPRPQRSDDYNVSKDREREQARAEFEKMLEAERNMGNDSGGRGAW